MIIRCCNTSVLLVFLILCVNIQVLSAQEVKLPEEIREALAQNAKQLSPITVLSTQQYRSLLPPEETIAKLKILNPPAEIFFAKQSQRVIWQDGKIYYGRTREGVSGTNEEQFESCFDGQILYMGDPNRRMPDGTPQPTLLKKLVSRVAETELDDQYLSTDYFDTIGLQLPTRMKDLQAKKSSGSEILLLLENGGHLRAVENTKLDERRLTRVELVADNPERRKAERMDLVEIEKELRSGKNTEQFIQQEFAVIKRMRTLPESRTYVFYLDPQMSYAVRRREERYEDGTLLLQVNNEEFEQLQGREVWLPRKSTVDYYTWPSVVGTYFKNPILSRVIEDAEFSLDSVPDKQFVLRYTTPGTIIYDRTVPGGELSFQIPTGLEGLDRMLESAHARSVPGFEKVKSISATPVERGLKGTQPLAESPGPMLSRGGGWLVLILLNAIALIALTVLTIWRYKGRSAANEM